MSSSILFFISYIIWFSLFSCEQIFPSNRTLNKSLRERFRISFIVTTLSPISIVTERANLFNRQPLQLGQIKSLLYSLKLSLNVLSFDFSKGWQDEVLSRERAHGVIFAIENNFFIGSGKLPNFSVVEKLYLLLTLP